MHARSGQLQGIFGFLRPLIHVRILVWSWSVDKNDGVDLRTAGKKSRGVIKIRLSSKHNEIESDTKQMQQKSDSLGETKLNFLEPRFYWSWPEREVPKETPFAVPKTAAVVASCGFESDWR